MKYRRILLKLSGETLAGDGGVGIAPAGLAKAVREIRTVWRRNVQVCVVIGAGNLWRGAGKSIDRVTADHMGMLATVMNALALADALRAAGVRVRALSAVEVPGFIDRYSRDAAVAALDDRCVVVCAGGTGNPLFTTDTTAALRAAEIKADVLLKATQVDGIYTADPRKDPKARKFRTLGFDEAIARRLKVMDTAAFSLCRENGVPIVVFDFHVPGNLGRAASGAAVGTVVR